VSNQTLSILSKIFKKKSSYNIITFDTHERYQTQLCKTGHDFYAFRYDGCKEWNETYAKIPDNYYILPKNTIPNGINYDFILSQSKFGQFQVAKQIQKVFNLPIISLEHTLPIPSWPNQQLEVFRQMNGDINVFISEYSCREWQMNGQVIHHSIDTETFKPSLNEGIKILKEQYALSVVNDYANRDYCCNFKGWQRITNGLKTRLVGDTPGLSKPAASIEELVSEYQNAAVFLNTSTVSPVPTSLLEAMSCGCAVVSTATCMIPEIIKNGINGFVSNDESELRGYIEKLLYDEKLREELGKNARKTIEQNFSEEKFVNNWNKIFAKI
jgi:glycosyltransferase involved in cell wall biosynthesis